MWRRIKRALGLPVTTPIGDRLEFYGRHNFVQTVIVSLPRQYGARIG